MKLVRQVVLGLREGTSDKVYEIDLCELGPDRFVVNFRFGRRGTRLQDGSKTPLPVGRADAERIFDALAREKRAKGYREGAPPAAAEPPPRFEDVEDPRARRVLAGLHGPDLDRWIWRAGELRVRAAVPRLVELLAGATTRRAWRVCRALLRCGDAAALPALYGQWESSGAPPHLRSMAGHAILACSPPDAVERFRRRVAAGLPDGALDALEGAAPDALADRLAADPGLADLLYQCADDRHRAGVLALAAALPLRHPEFLAVRRWFQAAEARGDGEVWGTLAHRMEVTRSAVSRVMRRRAGGVAGAWSTATRRWFRRRTWRTLLRLGGAGASSEYVSLASGLLVAAGPQPAGWAVSHVLAGGPGAGFDGRRLQIRRRSGAARPEAFAGLWDAEPGAAAALLSRARGAEVHALGVRVLRAQRGAWAAIPLADVIAWLGAPFPETVALGADVALGRFDPRHPDLSLVLALLGCGHGPARAAAEGWVRADPQPFLRDPEIVVALVLHEQPSTRRFALELLGSASLPPDRARVLVEAVCDAALRAPPEDEAATARLRDAAVVLLTAFPNELRSLPLDLVRSLVLHPSAGAAELGARILLVHERRAPDLPDDLLAAAMTSPHVAVRGIGVRLYGELPDAVLAERFRVLLALAANALADVRAAARPLLGRLVGAHPGFGRTFFRALLPVLERDGPEGLHADLVSLLRAELAPVAALVGAPEVLRLLKARDTQVQELGGEWLRAHVDPAALQPADLATLLASDVVAVRRTAQGLLPGRIAELRAAPDAVLPLLDGPWEDGRRWAMGFVRDDIGVEHLGAAVLVAVCDSVRPDVQAYGRSLLARAFEADDGPRYLAWLAQHPEPAMQAWASAWLEQHAGGHPDRLAALVPFFHAVLCRPNRGKVAKARVLAFLGSEALRDEASARVIAPVLSSLAASAARTHREAAISALCAVRARFPDVPTGVTVVPPEVRGAV